MIIMDIRVTAQTPETEANTTYLVKVEARNTSNDRRSAQSAFTIDPDVFTRLEQMLREHNARTASFPDATPYNVRDFGVQLFNYLFREDIKKLYLEIKARAARSQDVIRMRLELFPPELIMLPWELLHDQQQFLCLSVHPKILFARIPPDVAYKKSLYYTPPLRILGITAVPYGQQVLNIEQEKEHINQALADLQRSRRVDLQWRNAEISELQNMKSGPPWHVLHFIGHGAFDERELIGKLVCVDAYGKRQDYSADRLRVALHDDTRLVFLNACDTARGVPDKQMSSAAFLLAQLGVPAVIAMQFKISDDAAIQFAKEFYTGIAHEDAVDEAFTAARHKVYTGVTVNPLDWAVPVLYMNTTSNIRTANNALFVKDGSGVGAVEETDEYSAGYTAPLPHRSRPLQKTGPMSQPGPVATDRVKTLSPKPITRIFPSSFKPAPRVPRIIWLSLLLISAILVAGSAYLFFRPGTTPKNDCTISSTAGSQSPSIPFTTQDPAMRPIAGAPGETIGLSAGSLVFDTTSSADCFMQQAAQYHEQNDLNDFASYLSDATNTDPTNAEAKIYLEDYYVLNSHKSYVTLVVGGTFDPVIGGQTRDLMQGAYVAQHEYNAKVRATDQPELLLVIANAGKDYTNAAKVASSIANLAHNNRSVIGTIGWPLSSYADTANQVLQEKDVVMVSSAASSVLLDGAKGFLRIVPSDAEQAQVAAQYVKTQLKPQKVAILETPTENYSTSLAGAFGSEFSVRPQNYSYDPMDRDPYTSIVQKLVEQHVDMVYFAGYSQDVGVFLDTLQRMGHLGDFPIMGGDALSYVSDYPQGQVGLNNLIFTAFAAENEWTTQEKEQNANINTFLQEYQSDFSSSLSPLQPNGFENLGSSTLLGYDDTLITLKAYQLALKNDRTACLSCDMEKAFASMHGTNAYQGITGQISFNPGDNNPLQKEILLARFSENGALNVIQQNNCFQANSCS